MDSGLFSMSLAVQDIEKSIAFYALLGFAPMEGCGGVAEKWVMLKKGDVMIGLFEGMFDKDMLTFNPADARGLQAHLAAHGADAGPTLGPGEGPCHFTARDPDGRLILFDQF